MFSCALFLLFYVLGKCVFCKIPASCPWCRTSTFSCISLMRYVISSYSVNTVRLLKCVIPCGPDTMGYMAEKGVG